MKSFDLRVWATAFALLGACSPSADDATGQPAGAAASPKAAMDLNLIATVDVAGGNVVEFYEPSPGHVVVSEVYQQSNPPAMTTALARVSPTQAYRTLAPGSEVPDSLVQAEQRMRKLLAGPPAQGDVSGQSAPGGGGGPGTPRKGTAAAPPEAHTDGAYSASYFMSWAPGCPNHYDQNHYNWCKTDVGGFWYYYANGADADYGVVCTDVGSATFVVIQDGTGSINVPAGYCRSYQSFVSDDPFDLFDFDIEFQAYANTGGSLFHFAGYLEW